MSNKKVEKHNKSTCQIKEYLKKRDLILDCQIYEYTPIFDMSNLANIYVKCKNLTSICVLCV